MTLLQQVARQPLSLHKELIIVDDFSTDGTREFLQQTDLEQALGGNGANTVKLVLHEKNMGKGTGVRTGFEHATGEVVLIQDADLEYDPRDYPALITPILEGHADAVFGNRFHDGAHRVPRYGRFVLNRVFSTVCNILTGLNIHDVTACYKVFRRDLLAQDESSAPTASASKPRWRSRSPSWAHASTKCPSSTTAAPTPKARKSTGPTASPRFTTCFCTASRTRACLVVPSTSLRIRSRKVSV